jgi:hypothetical protein
MWRRSIPRNFGDIQQNTDLVFIFASGYISLKKGETKRISMAFLFGEDLNDLLVTAETVQNIYDKNYRFFKPPTLPKVTAVPGDKKVTLYWDSSAEESLDPITGKDFEGYVIYRSTDPSFIDQRVVTDGRGASFLYNPLKDLSGFDAKWDVKNEWSGYHPVPYLGRGIHYYLGDNIGLRHSFVDSNQVINGQTYYYAVVAYDHGDSIGIPPSETTKKISVDPITSELRFADNTVQAIPGPRTSGYQAPSLNNGNIIHEGYGNGAVDFEIIDDLKVKDSEYILTFSDTLYQTDTSYAQKNFSVEGLTPITEDFYLFGTRPTRLENSNLIDDANLKVEDQSGVTYTRDVDYNIDLVRGKVNRTSESSMPDNARYLITYRYYPISQSITLQGEDSNPVFDGISLSISDYETLAHDEGKSMWTGSVDLPYTFALASVGAASRKKLYPADYDLIFSDTKEFTTRKIIGGQQVEIPARFKVEDVTSGVPQLVQTLLVEKGLNDDAWSRGDEIVLFLPGSTDTLTWGITVEEATEGDSAVPVGGDVLHLITQRPFTPVDRFHLKTLPGEVNQSVAKDRLSNIYVVPNPYVAANDLEPANRLSSQSRGERRIYFENLPQECTIRIYTLSGELVAQLEHNAGVDHGREYWNLLNKDGFSVAYGLYLAHIDAKDLGETIIKFALIK